MGTVLMKVTFSDEELARIDAVRGQTPRATWVRLAAVALSGEGVSGSPPARPPAPEPDRGPKPKAEPRTYVVENGDTLPKVPVRLPKAERLAARGIVSQPRPIVQKRGK